MSILYKYVYVVHICKVHTVSSVSTGPDFFCMYGPLTNLNIQGHNIRTVITINHKYIGIIYTYAKFTMGFSYIYVLNLDPRRSSK